MSRFILARRAEVGDGWEVGFWGLERGDRCRWERSGKLGEVEGTTLSVGEGVWIRGWVWAKDVGLAVGGFGVGAEGDRETSGSSQSKSSRSSN